MENLSTIELDAGTETDKLSNYILGSLTDDEIDDIEVRRTLAPATSMANEPVTIGLILVAGAKAAAAIAGAITAYMKYRTQQLENQAKLQPHQTVTIRVLEGEVPESIRKLAGTVRLETPNKA
jgi:hypothetical protein